MSTSDVGSPSRAAVSSYLAGMRAALDDLPATEVDEIMEDVGPHVAEVADELGEDDLERRLADRLGGPQEYAAELRAAGGYPPRTPPPPSRFANIGTVRAALWALVAAIVLAFCSGLLGDSLFGIFGFSWGQTAYSAGVGWPLVLSAGCALGSLFMLLRMPRGVFEVLELPELARVRAAARARSEGTFATYARLLQPSWWLARAGIAALMVVVPLETYRYVGPLPLLALFVVFAIGSVWLGRRSQTDRRWLWAALPLNAFAIGLSLFLVDRAAWYPIALTGSDPPATPHTSQLRPPGHTNVFVFDSAGKLLTDVYLYDQDGRPITPYYDTESCTPEPSNRYPKPEVTYQPDGTCVEVPARPPAVPFVTPSTPTSPPATTATSPSPTTGTATPTK